MSLIEQNEFSLKRCVCFRNSVYTDDLLNAETEGDWMENSLMCLKKSQEFLPMILRASENADMFDLPK